MSTLFASLPGPRTLVMSSLAVATTCPLKFGPMALQLARMVLTLAFAAPVSSDPWRHTLSSLLA
jgi:hypothetical protein